MTTPSDPSIMCPREAWATSRRSGRVRRRRRRAASLRPAWDPTLPCLPTRQLDHADPPGPARCPDWTGWGRGRGVADHQVQTVPAVEIDREVGAGGVAQRVGQCLGECAMPDRRRRGLELGWITEDLSLHASAGADRTPHQRVHEVSCQPARTMGIRHPDQRVQVSLRLLYRAEDDIEHLVGRLGVGVGSCRPARAWITITVRQWATTSCSCGRSSLVRAELLPPRSAPVRSEIVGARLQPVRHLLPVSERQPDHPPTDRHHQDGQVTLEPHTLTRANPASQTADQRGCSWLPRLAATQDTPASSATPGNRVPDGRRQGWVCRKGDGPDTEKDDAQLHAQPTEQHGGANRGRAGQNKPVRCLRRRPAGDEEAEDRDETADRGDQQDGRQRRTRACHRPPEGPRS